MQAPGVLLFVLRHGQTDYNAQRRFQGQSQTLLNNEGREQARRSGEIVANLLGEIVAGGGRVVEAVTSDLPRASETADIVARIVEERLAQPLLFSPNASLRELNIGALQDHTVDEYEQTNPGFMTEFCRQWEIDPYETRYPGDRGESRAMVAERVAPLVQRLNGAAAAVGQVAANHLRSPLRRPAELFLWSSHGAVIDVLLELLQAELGGEHRIIGNGDLLLFEPRLNSVKQLSAKGRVTKDFAERHGCKVEWNLLRHYRIGDTVAARIKGPKVADDSQK